MFGKNRDFAEDYNLYYPLVYSTVYARVGSFEDAEDLCQDIFVKYYEKLTTIEDKRKWLNGAIRLELMNYFRKKKYNQEDIDNLINDASLTYINGFRDLRIILEEIINSIEIYDDESERVLFELIAVKGFSYEEAGGQLGYSKRQARYRYNRVNEKILDYLAKKGIRNLEDLL